MREVDEALAQGLCPSRQGRSEPGACRRPPTGRPTSSRTMPPHEPSRSPASATAPTQVAGPAPRGRGPGRRAAMAGRRPQAGAGLGRPVRSARRAAHRRPTPPGPPRDPLHQLPSRRGPHDPRLDPRPRCAAPQPHRPGRRRSRPVRCWRGCSAFGPRWDWTTSSRAATPCPTPWSMPPTTTSPSCRSAAPSPGRATSSPRPPGPAPSPVSDASSTSIILDGGPLFTGLSAAVLHRSVDAAVLVCHRGLTGERAIVRARRSSKAAESPCWAWPRPSSSGAWEADHRPTPRPVPRSPERARSPRVAVYESHYNLERRPFGESVDPSVYVALPSHEIVLRRLRYALEQSRAPAILYGPSGSGKTLLARRLASQLGGPSVHLTFPALPAAELIGTARRGAGRAGRAARRLGEALQAVAESPRRDGRPGPSPAPGRRRRTVDPRSGHIRGPPAPAQLRDRRLARPVAAPRREHRGALRPAPRPGRSAGRPLPGRYPERGRVVGLRPRPARRRRGPPRDAALLPRRPPALYHALADSPAASIASPISPS